MRSLFSVDMLTLFPYVASGGFSLGLVLIALLNGKRRDEVTWFVAVLALEAAWAATFLLEVMASTTAAKLVWDALHWPLIVATDASILLFARAYVDPVGSRHGSA
ncbi:MAG TPA: histidine kinase N-terminal 7TM domain-containing protein, partial [Spirochaetales bacterium]|nr:histidine kinase N-terminal 7TM domain-containing protein [Spirochaetales bacterium]